LDQVIKGMIKNVIFDWSGTLADDLAAVLIATNGVLAHHGQNRLTREEFRSLFRLPYTEFYRELLPDVGLDKVKELYLQHFPADDTAVPMLPHAVEFLQYCALTGRRMVVLSSAPEEHVRAQAKANGVEHFFEAFWCGVVDKRQTIHDLLLEQKMSSDTTMFIGDMRHDIDAAKSGGVLSVATATGYETPQVLMQSCPDLLISNLSYLPILMGPAHPLSTVGALIFNQEGKILLVRTHKWKNKWGIAGGKIRRSETAEEALRRETREETGLEIGDIRFAMVQDCVEPEEFESAAHFILLNYTARISGTGDSVILNDEAEEFIWVTSDVALTMDLNKPTRYLIELAAKESPAAVC